MKIVKVIPESFQEFEDHISIVLFCYGCNLHCSYCYNYDYVSDSNLIIDESVESIVSRSVTPLTDGLVFLGGEPTIYGEELFSLSKFVKDSFNLDVKLFTNGTRPDIVLSGLVFKMFDRVSIDLKCLEDHGFIDFSNSNLTFDEYKSRVLFLLETIHDLRLSDFVEVRTTKSEMLPNSEIIDITSICNNYGIKHYIQEDVLDSYSRLGVVENKTIG